MTLIKTIASYLKEDGTWEPQSNVEMHPLEEAQVLAEWAIHDEKIKIPEKPTREQEHEWLIDHGPDFVKQKRQEWQSLHDLHMPSVKAAEEKYEASIKRWRDHCEYCQKENLNPDTHDKEGYLNAAKEIKL